MRFILQVASGIFIGGIALLAAWLVLEGLTAQTGESDRDRATSVATAAVLGMLGVLLAIGSVYGLWRLADIIRDATL